MTSSYLTQPLGPEAEFQGRKDALSVAVAWRKIIWRQAAKDEDERMGLDITQHGEQAYRLH